MDQILEIEYRISNKREHVFFRIEEMEIFDPHRRGEKGRVHRITASGVVDTPIRISGGFLRRDRDRLFHPVIS